MQRHCLRAASYVILIMVVCFTTQLIRAIVNIFRYYKIPAFVSSLLKYAHLQEVIETNKYERTWYKNTKIHEEARTERAAMQQCQI